jgi:hypothetical protein
MIHSTYELLVVYADSMRDLAGIPDKARKMIEDSYQVA